MACFKWGHIAGAIVAVGALLGGPAAAQEIVPADGAVGDASAQDALGDSFGMVGTAPWQPGALDGGPGGDDAQIGYYTPRFGGFRFGIGYITAADETGSAVAETQAQDGAQDWIGAGIDFTTGFGLAGTGSIGQIRQDEETGFTAGAQLTFGDFTVGGGYVEAPGTLRMATGTGMVEQQGFSVGASYALGGWDVGFNYSWNDQAAATDLTGNPSAVTGTSSAFSFAGEYEALGAGVSYSLAPGLTLGADVLYWDRGNADATAGDGVVIITGIEAAF